MHVMTDPQAFTTAHAIREARTLAAYIQLLVRSSSIALPVELSNQAARLSAALHAMDATKDKTHPLPVQPAASQPPTSCRA